MNYTTTTRITTKIILAFALLSLPMLTACGGGGGGGVESASLDQAGRTSA